MTTTPWSGWLIDIPQPKEGSDLTGRIEKGRKARRAQEQWTMDRLAVVDKQLLDGLETHPPTKAIVDQLIAEISTCKGRVKKWRHNYLLRGLNRGARELGWPSFSHAPIVKLKLRGSPLNAMTFPMVGKVRRLREALLEHIERTYSAKGLGDDTSSPAAPPLQRAGEVLLSCVLFGGVANKHRLAAVAAHGLNGIDAYKEWMWVEWNETQDSASANWQRWLPDPLSALLLAKARASKQDQLMPVVAGIAPNALLWKALKEVIGVLRLEEKDRPTSITMLMQWASAWAYRHLPPFMAEYATGKLPCASLPPGAWRRLLTKTPQPAEAAAKSSQPATDAAVTKLASGQLKNYNGSPVLPEDLENCAKGLRRILRGLLDDGAPPGKRNRSPHKIHHALYRFTQQENLPPIVQLLAGWSYLRMRSDTNERTSLSVTRIQLEAIDRLLMDAVGLDDLVTYDEERLLTIFQSVIDASVTAKRHNQRVAALSSFHGHLQRQLGISALPSQLFDGVPDDGGIDANCLGEDEVEDVLKLLAPNSSTHNQRLALAHQVAFLLSARCTLRRGEVHQLRLTSIQGALDLCLVLRRRKDETLKSNNAVRVIPLAALLSDKELKLVIDYRDDIAKGTEHARTSKPSNVQIVDDDVLLFCRESNPLTALTEASLFEPIESAMRHVTGDDSLRFHHGRHTAVAHLLLKLFESTLPGAAKIVGLPITSDASVKFQNTLIGNEDPNRQHLWTTAIIAGHATPEVTIGSYFHLCDWLLFRATHAYQQDIITLDLLATVLRTKIGTVEREAHRLGILAKAAFAIPLKGMKEFSGCWPTAVSGNSVVEAAAAVLPPTSLPLPVDPPIGLTTEIQPSLLSARGHKLNAVQILNLLDELDSKHGAQKKISPSKKSKTKQSTTTKTTDQIARSHDVSIDDALALWEQVELLENIIGNSPHRKKLLAGSLTAIPSIPFCGAFIERPLPRMRPVRSKVEVEQIVRLFAAFEAEWLIRPDRLKNFLVLHWKQLDLESHTFKCADPKETLGWLEFMNDISAAAKLSALQIVHRANERPGKSSVTDQRKYWATSLAINFNQISAGTGLLKPKGDQGYGFIEISLPHSQPLTDQWQHQKRVKGITESRSRAASVALDAAAYVYTLLLLLVGPAATNQVTPSPTQNNGSPTTDAIGVEFQDANEQTKTAAEPDENSPLA